MRRNRSRTVLCNGRTLLEQCRYYVTSQRKQRSRSMKLSYVGCSQTMHAKALDTALCGNPCWNAVYHNGLTRLRSSWYQSLNILAQWYGWLNSRITLCHAGYSQSQYEWTWKDNVISVNLKTRCVLPLSELCPVWHGESWTHKEDDEKRIHAFEMWVWRTMIRISWTQR